MNYQDVSPQDGKGGVNPGDQRMLYTLVSELKSRPPAILEIGTHVGASTIAMAAAGANVTTVDIADVNAALKPGVRYTPAQALTLLGLQERVLFVQARGADVLRGMPAKHLDLVFLDGSHAEDDVFEEIPLALRVLAPGGLLVLHDYFPGLAPLWANGKIIPGPFRAVERLGLMHRVQPLGELPWPTKLGSNVTSLAVLRND